jgi:crossover junction endodeoxyribonuclease RusA
MPTRATNSIRVRIEFDVAGVAQPKGSTRAFMPKGAAFPVVTTTNRSLKAWQYAVQRAAGLEFDRQVQGPIALLATFYLPRPKSTRKGSYHLKKPDLDKLTRAIGDALTGTAYRDDSEIVSIHTHKCYADDGMVPHARIVIEGFRPLA